jgi:CubicO group peptidase (beta-lactamase class C family)
MKRYIEKHYNKNLDELTQNHFYSSLGMNRTGYLPLNKFPKKEIIPTEDDKTFRNQLIHGYVHDQGAAMQGGIGGHAGIFSTTNDVAKMMQMYLQGGTYGGRQYLKQETIDKFNTCYYCENDVRRGVGFDKPQLEDSGPTCGCVGRSSFGHSGFTGAYTWADPEEEIVYVFLSNRVHPDADNRFIIQENIRTNIQQIIYDSIID